MRNFLRTYWSGLVLLSIFIYVSISVYQDYGLASDEDAQRSIGQHYYSYVFENDTSFHSYIEKDHGAGFELPLIILEKKMELHDLRDVYLMRHIVSNLFFLFCMFFGYVLVYKLFNNQWYACLAFIMLVLHPRLYAHSYFNSKDIPAMGTFLLAIFATHWAFTQKKVFPYLILGIICGYSASIRLMNIIILLPILLFMTVDVMQVIKNKKTFLPIILFATVFLLTFCMSLYICWPTLWGNPVGNLIGAYNNLAKFRWKGSVLFSGVEFKPASLPWSYIPTWFLLTTPELWVALGLIGIMVLFTRLIDAPSAYFIDVNKRMFVLSLFCFLFSIALVIKIGAVVYDDWRHLYFIYPCFVLLALFGLNTILRKKNKWIIVGLCVLEMVSVSRFMVKAHPYQQVYFNYLTSHQKDTLQKQYELDYWGSSYKQGLEWVLLHSSSDSIRINNDWLLNFNTLMLDTQNRKRFIPTGDINKLDYYLECMRYRDYKFKREQSVYNIDVLNSTILRVTKLR